MISARDLAKRYGNDEVLRDISLEVSSGEVAAIIGPSGGGKSTFLRCLIGLERFESGWVEVDGLRLAAGMAAREAQPVLRQLRRRVGMIFQEFNLFPHRSVLENVTEAPIRVLKRSREEAEREARVLLERVGLGDKLDQRPGALSGGQQQRVAIARALAMKPRVVLFDEPTSALDPRMAAEVQSVMKDLARSGQTMIVVTHSMNFARTTAHRVHFLEGGRLAESGTPQQIFEDPQNPLTRQFLADLQAK